MGSQPGNRPEHSVYAVRRVCGLHPVRNGGGHAALVRYEPVSAGPQLGHRHRVGLRVRRAPECVLPAADFAAFHPAVLLPSPHQSRLVRLDVHREQHLAGGPELLHLHYLPGLQRGAEFEKYANHFSHAAAAVCVLHRDANHTLEFKRISDVFLSLSSTVRVKQCEIKIFIDALRSEQYLCKLKQNLLEKNSTYIPFRKSFCNHINVIDLWRT